MGAIFMALWIVALITVPLKIVDLKYLLVAINENEVGQSTLEQNNVEDMRKGNLVLICNFIYPR